MESEINMFTKAEEALIDNEYFIKIRETENYIEFKSKNTKHCWIVQKHFFDDDKRIYIYHKHSQKQPYYHQHYKTHTVSMAIKSIKKHDEYVLANAYH